MPSKLDLKHGKAQKHVKSMCGTHPSVKYYNSFSLLWASHVRVSELSLLLGFCCGGANLCAVH